MHSFIVSTLLVRRFQALVIDVHNSSAWQRNEIKTTVTSTQECRKQQFTFYIRKRVARVVVGDRNS